MPNTMEQMLTDQQLLQLERDGYVIVPGLFSSDEVAEIRETFMAEAADGPVEGLSEFKNGTRPAYDPSDPLAYYPRMMNPHSHTELAVGTVAGKYMLDGRLKPIIEAGLGEEPVAVQSMFYFKPAGARGQDLHQDNFYLRVKPGTCMAAWLSIDDADEENGGMVVVPGSNRMEIVCPEKADSTLFFTSDHVDVPAGLHEEQIRLKAGDVLFFNGSVIHGSYPNTSRDRFRRSLIFHYAPRFSQELAYWYKNPTTFDGEMIEIAEAQGGGPCGVAQPMGPH
jgi:phytanoyl-CoA hydroxylase